MLLLRRFTPFLCALTQGALLAFVIWRPVWLLKILGIVMFSNWQIITLYAISLASILAGLFIIGAGEPLHSRYRFALLPVLLSVSGFSIVLYTEYPPALYALAVVIPCAIGLWLEILYYFWQRPDLYHPYTLQKIASYLYLIEIFLFVAALVGLQVLVQWPAWLMMLIAIAVFWIIQIDLLRLHQFDVMLCLVFSLFGTIMAAEILVALNLLPTHFFMDGLLIALFFYAWFGIGKQFLLKEFDRPQFATYIIVAALGSCLTVLSSLWFT